MWDKNIPCDILMVLEKEQMEEIDKISSFFITKTIYCDGVV